MPLYFAPRAPRFTAATKPAAGAAWLGQRIHVYDSGSPTEVLECVQTSSGSYEWIFVGIASS